MNNLKKTLPYCYVAMVLFVVFHNTGYQFVRMLEVPYILYVLLAGLGFIVIRNISRESDQTTD